MNTTPATDPAPPCAGPDRTPRPPRLHLPAHSCDAHAHVFGPQRRYAYSPARIYTPPDALPMDYRGLLDTMGVERAVLVQPSVYGSDNEAMLDALARDPQRLRGVAVVEPDTPRSELDRMHALGVRGVRCNVVDVKEGRGELPLSQLHALAGLIAPLGWHLELLVHVDAYPELDRMLADFPVDLVFGHLGYMTRSQGVDAPGFVALQRLLQRGRTWVKLSGPYRISTHGLPYPDVAPLARALVAAAPDRVVWGSDWPHVMLKGPMPNDGALCDLLVDWLPNTDLLERALTRVLVRNPAQLYGFALA